MIERMLTDILELTLILVFFELKNRSIENSLEYYIYVVMLVVSLTVYRYQLVKKLFNLKPF